MSGWRCRTRSNFLRPCPPPKAASTASTCSAVVASSQDTDMWSTSISQTLMPRALAASRTCAARPGTRASTVSKNSLCTTSTPAAARPAASARAWPCTRRAIPVSPSAP